MSPLVYVAGFGVIGVGGYLGYLMFEAKARLIPHPSAPEIPVGDLPLTTFADELRAIDVPAPANYRSGEYPVVEVPAVVVEEPVEHVARHAADERVLSDARPWLTPALHQEATPFFWATGELPTYDVDQLSATNSWDRAALLAKIRQAEAEQAGVEAA